MNTKTTLNLSTPPDDILKAIRLLREKKGKEKETLAMVGKAVDLGSSYIIELLWEQALLFQHIAMKEYAKGDNMDPIKRKKSLLDMAGVIADAEYFINKYKLYQWRSRLYRFKGRVADYMNDFESAIVNYKKAILFVKSDPEYKERKIPRWLELEAFLSYSLLMSGELKKGLELSKKIYLKFENTTVGKNLKKSDYTTWAIWRTGIPIRTINALLDKKTGLDKEMIINWIASAEKDLYPTKSIKTWADFVFRIDEINALKSRLQKIN